MLHGIPILVKDSISAHGMNNTAGSYCLAGARTKNEASLITRLRNAGAIILGKANMAQWGNARSSGDNASNGWSSWGGQTYGVYVTEQDPCGSSSGSAVAMALGLAAVTVGVERVGSITCPAMKSNVVSIKPTAGLVPKDNIIVTKRRGSVGPMASTIRDAAILLTFMAGKSDSDPRTNHIPFETVPNYAASCDLSALRGSRTGVPRNGLKNPIGVDINTTAIMNAYEEAISLLMANGATIIDNANYPAYDEVYSIEPQQIVGPAEYKVDLAEYFDNLSVNPYNIHSISDLIICTKSHPKEEFPSRNIDFWETVKDAPDFSSPEITAAFEHMRFLGAEGGIDGALDKAKADALVLPSVICSDIPGLAGYPTITVPMGYLPNGTPITKNPRGDLVDEAPNVPFGLCFIGRAFSEEKLIGFAYAFEQLTQVAIQRAPVILPKTELIDIIGKRSSYMQG